ncbi:MAG: response regulator [Planctomycetales bacterium]|nr:response regulator [Planctomycetales bacterium]
MACERQVAISPASADALERCSITMEQQANLKSNRSQRLVVLAPTPHDAYVCANVLRDVNIEAKFCDGIEPFCDEISTEAGAALIAQEHLTAAAIDRVKQTLLRQPTWSDFPLLVLLSAGETSATALEQMLSMGHVTLVNRPLRIATFVNTLRARLRDRQRQYAVRDLLQERQQAIESSRQDAMRIQMALRAGGMGAWEERNNEVFWSPKMFDLFGVPKDQKPSMQAALDRVHPDDLGELMHRWNATIRKGKPFQHEFRILHPQRGLRWLAAVGEPVKSKSGKVLRHAGLHWDVTEHREYQQSLEEARRQAEVANQSKSAFLANMSHEIRTPMTAILGYTDLIADKIADEDTLQHVRTIRRNGAFLLDIINDILDLSKIEAQKLDILRERFSPARLVEDVRSIMEVRATENHLDLDVEYQSELPVEIESDPKRLRQVLINLVGNAIKFTRRGGVRVLVSFADEKLRFEIVDSGIGMNETQLGRIFQAFSQGDHTVNREFGGTGLGLAISQRLTEMLGGTISVESEEGKGSKFIVTVSVGDISDVSMHQPTLIDDSAIDSNEQVNIALDCRILVVDDRRDVRFLSGKFLRDAGATVSEAEDGELAVAAVAESMSNGDTYDLVLLDMQMPKLDGYGAAKAIRRLGYTNPIIALTADAMQGDMKRCIDSGCNDYLSKPINKALMLTKVKAYVENDRESP